MWGKEWEGPEMFWDPRLRASVWQMEWRLGGLEMGTIPGGEWGGGALIGMSRRAAFTGSYSSIWGHRHTESATPWERERLPK